MSRVQISIVGMCALILLFAIGAENVFVGRFFPQLPRVATDFSPAYIEREVKTLSNEPAGSWAVFLGDSVVWGFRLRADQTAVSDLVDRGCKCVNLAFKAGSQVNYYALVRLMISHAVRPRVVVLELTQKVFNPEDAAYATLVPGLARSSMPLLDASDRATLKGFPDHSLANAADQLVSSLWKLYAMRSDIRETWFAGPDTSSYPKPSVDLYAGTYDLSPLDDKNVEVRYFQKTLAILRSNHIPVLAFFTPTNHALLGDYIDNNAYRSNTRFLASILKRSGARVLDLDTAFKPDEFIDEVHLTASGQRHLADLLESALSR